MSISRRKLFGMIGLGSAVGAAAVLPSAAGPLRPSLKSKLMYATSDGHGRVWAEGMTWEAIDNAALSWAAGRWRERGCYVTHDGPSKWYQLDENTGYYRLSEGA